MQNIAHVINWIQMALGKSHKHSSVASKKPVSHTAKLQALQQPLLFIYLFINKKRIRRKRSLFLPTNCTETSGSPSQENICNSDKLIPKAIQTLVTLYK